MSYSLQAVYKSFTPVPVPLDPHLSNIPPLNTPPGAPSGTHSKDTGVKTNTLA